MSGPLEALTLRAQEHGCNACGVRGDVFYGVEFYILPTKKVRKRHKDRKQCAIYCRNCYEQHSDLPFHVDGESASVPVPPRINPQDHDCAICGEVSVATLGRERLYGLITSTLWMELSMIENHCLAFFCESCVESHKISLLAKI
jgi:hypothetical protein